MSAPSPSWRAQAARWLRRGAAAVGSAALDAALDSLELGKRGVAWLAHSPGARVVVVAALALAVAGGAAWAMRRVYLPRVARATTLAARVGPAVHSRDAAISDGNSASARGGPQSPHAGT